MRRLQALLMAVGLLAAPTSAVAGPSETNPETRRAETAQVAPSKARLGVLVITMTPELRRHLGAPEGKGVLVGRVEPGSAAAAAGVRVGDVLTDVKGTGVDAADDVVAALAGVGKDARVSLAIVRDRKPMSLTATMTATPGPQSLNDLPWPRWMKEWVDALPDDPWSAMRDERGVRS